MSTIKMTPIRQLIEEGKIRLGMTKAELRALLGPPDDWGNTSGRYPEPSIWLYGCFEFWFEVKPYRIPWPGPRLKGIYTEDKNHRNWEMLLGPSNGKSEILPPGQHPFDPVKPEIDPVGYALGRLQTFLIWIEEHRSSYEKLRNTNQESAERELRNLENSTNQAVMHLQRLMELLLAGYSIDPEKRLPKDLSNSTWLHWVQWLRENHP